MTQELELDCLDQLEATPAILRGLMCDLSVEDTEWKPAPDRFSVAEVLAHLSHSEGHCYRTRVDRLVSEELPEFESHSGSANLNGKPHPTIVGLPFKFEPQAEVATADVYPIAT